MNSKRFHFMFFLMYNLTKKPKHIQYHLNTSPGNEANTLQNMRKFKVNCRVIQSIIQMPRCTWIYWFQGEKLIFISVKEFYRILLFIFTP